MSVECFIILFVGFIFGFGFYAFFDVACELYIYFHRKNIDYREKKQDKKSKKEEVEKWTKSGCWPPPLIGGQKIQVNIL